MADRNIVIGIDLGRLVDHSVACVTEHVAEVRYITFPPPHQGHTGEDCDCHEQITHKYQVLALRRWPLLTSFTRVVVEVGAMMKASGLEDAVLAIDCTGIGRDIYGLFVNAYRAGKLGHYCPIGYHIAGSGESDGPDDTSSYLRITKTDLTARLITALEGHLLTIPAALPDAQHLQGELANFRRKITKRGLQTFAAAGTHEHDDAVSALMLSIWRENHHTEPRRVMAPTT